MSDDLGDAAVPASVRKAVARERKRLPTPMEHGFMESLREATYDGHEIVVRTSYTIEVDGQPLTGHIGVGDDGRVHYHAVPERSFTSAIDLVKKLIDLFPDDFPPPYSLPRAQGGRGRRGHMGGGH